MVRVSGWRWVWGVMVVCIVIARMSYAQVTLTTLVNFDGTNGNTPQGALTQGADGDFYGTTSYGGESFCQPPGCGTVYKVTPKGTLTTLYDFCSKAKCAGGAEPLGSLAQSADGDFYGVTSSGGGTNQEGTVYKVSRGGRLTTLYRFCSLYRCRDGQFPDGGLVQAPNGDFYGTTEWGGASNAGTVFKITPAGFLTTIYDFCSLSDCSDGVAPNGALVQAPNGNFYGETTQSGIDRIGFGTIFEITPRGKLTTRLTFDDTDGAYPVGGLVQGRHGFLYGVTGGGGSGTGPNCNGCGTVFQITPAGKLTTLHNFCSVSNCADGWDPVGPLVPAANGNLYGATRSGGVNLAGTLFEITPGGELTTLYAFCSLPNCADGFSPLAGLVQATSGAFYGATDGGWEGAQPDGTIFILSAGLGPFVKTQPTFAKEGATIGILGQGFGDTSVVQFGGVQATNIKISESSFLFATVPAGALTGSVTVTTGATTLTSNQPFRVKPQVVSFDPPSGAVGTQVTITGTGFTQTNGVGFGDNVPAAFTVNSDTQVRATVPVGAKTGPIGVVTKGGTAISSATFTLN